MRDGSMQQMNDITIWWLIIVCGVITFFIRFSFFQLVNDKMVNRIKDLLGYMPASIFAAIVAGGVFNNGLNSLTLNNFKIYAAIVAFFIAIKFRGTIITILSGLLVLWSLKYFIV
ncbi:MAG: AzlD domain-containing protein [Calditerrivibrio sp.]|nr:AzlD domain-containing protein [Calditerrivibrio sp.]